MTSTVSLLTGCSWDAVYRRAHTPHLAPTTHSQAWALLLKHLCPSPDSLLAIYDRHVTKNLVFFFLHLMLDMCRPTSRGSWNYHVRLFARLALGAVVTHAGGLVVVFVLTAVGVFSAGGVHQGDLSPESIPEHRHFHRLRPPRLAPCPPPAAVAQKLFGPAL